MAEDQGEGFAPFDLYPYNPSQPPAYIFVGLFGAACVLHLVAMIVYRAAFPLPLTIGCGMEAAAYYFRSRSHDDVRRTLPFIIQNLLLLAAPPFLAASVYMSLRRIARVLGCEDLIISPRLLTKLFVLVDVACFVTQVAGAIMSGSEVQDEARLGKTIIVAGLGLQIGAFVLFSAWNIHAHVRIRSSPRSTARPHLNGWQRCVFGLYAISLLFIVRNTTRLVEYDQGSGGELLSNEVFLYVLDALIMLVIVVLFLVFHPARLRFKARRVERKKLSDSHIPLNSYDP